MQDARGGFSVLKDRVGDTLDPDRIYRIRRERGGVGWCTAAGDDDDAFFSPRGEATGDGRRR